MKTNSGEGNIPGSINEVLFEGYLHNKWIMTEAERCIFIMLLDKIRPGCAVEIGTAEGGSLSVLSRFSKKVYTLDIDPTCREKFGRQFPNAEFVTGLSQETLPPLLDQLQKSDAGLGFIFIDGDHSREGVKRDIENVLKFRPTQPLYLVMHDSFNPDCRRGMMEAKWAANPYVHFIELDFVPGQFPAEPENCCRQMWCGFGLALMLPVERTGSLIIHENERLLFQTVLSHSVYQKNGFSKLNPLRIVQGLRQSVKRILKRET